MKIIRVERAYCPTCNYICDVDSRGLAPKVCPGCGLSKRKYDHVVRLKKAIQRIESEGAK